MQHNTVPKTDLSEVLLWTEWIDLTSRRLSFILPPKELLILFVVQSLELAHSLNSILDKSLPKEVVDGHIRGYLLDRLWSYHLVTASVQDDVRACASGVARLNSKQLLRACRQIVARVMLEPGLPNEDADVRTTARRAILSPLEISAPGKGRVF